MKVIIRGGFFLLCFCIPALSGFAQSEIVTIRTVAGNGVRGYDGDGVPALAVPLIGPTGVAVDAAGNLYIADIFVHKVTPGGIITRNVISPELGVGGVAVDAAGNVFADDPGWSIVFKMTSGVVSCCVAGNGTPGYSGDGGHVVFALLNEPTGLAVDAAGNLYIADTSNHRIRRVTPGGVITTFAGNGTPGFSGDGGPATSAQLNSPHGVAVDMAGNIYITDLSDRVRMVTPDGVIRTVAGNGVLGFSGDGGPATSAQLNVPSGVAVDTAGNIYIADYLNNRVRKVTPDGVIHTIAGNGTAGFSGDGGPAADSQLNHPQGVAVDVAGNLYIADTENRRVRKVGSTPASTREHVGLRSDFNGDGRTDLLWRDAAGNVSTWLMNGYDITDSSFIANIWTGWTIIGSGDFNGDGKAGILWRDPAGNVATWLMDGARVASYSSTGNIPMVWSIAGVGDFDADGKADILWRDRFGNGLIWLMNGQSIANYSFIVSVWSGWTIAAIADFDADGKADILGRDATGNVKIWLMDGASIASSTTIGNIWLGWSIVGMGDFNGDGKADILWRDTSGNVAIWLMDGTAIASYSSLGNIWLSWSIAGVGDFNGDGKADILWRDVSGEMAIWQMDGTTVSSYSSIGNVADRIAQ